MAWRKSAAVEERRARVAQLMLDRLSIREIAGKLETPRSTIARDVVAVREEWQRERLTAIDGMAAEELQRINRLEQAYWQLAAEPQIETLDNHLQALDRILKLMERRAKLLGLDAPKKIDITGKLRELVAEAGLSEEDASAAIREAMAIVGEADR